MKRKRIILIIAACIASVCLIVCALWSGREIMNGTRVNEPDKYSLDFTLMNGTDTAELTLSGGDTLSVSFDLGGGRGDIYICSSTGEKLYTGNDIRSGGFLLDIPADGVYAVTFTARHAAGYLLITK